jgi:hypothetical protein
MAATSHFTSEKTGSSGLSDLSDLTDQRLNPKPDYLHVPKDIWGQPRQVTKSSSETPPDNSPELPASRAAPTLPCLPSACPKLQLLPQILPEERR